MWPLRPFSQKLPYRWEPALNFARTPNLIATSFGRPTRGIIGRLDIASPTPILWMRPSHALRPTENPPRAAKQEVGLLNKKRCADSNTPPASWQGVLGGATLLRTFMSQHRSSTSVTSCAYHTPAITACWWRTSASPLQWRRISTISEAL